MAKDHGSKKGTRKVEVPDLSILSISDARTALTNLGLNYSDISTNTGVSVDNTKVFGQSPAAGTIVLLGSSVSIDYYTYIVPPFFPFFPFFPPSFPSFPSFPYFPYFPCNPLEGQSCFRSAPGTGGKTCFYSSVYSCNGACVGGSLDFCL
jgi:hypothetical protein